MANNKFSAEVDEIIANTKERLHMVMQQSLLDAVNEMQTVGWSVAATKAAIKKGLGGRGKKRRNGPVNRTGKGGRMRVDTGFLRASGQSSLNGMPTGPGRGTDGKSYDWSSEQTEVTIGQMQFGSTFFFGWTAKYAKYREAYDGFMSATLQNWQQIVDKVVEDAKRRF